MGTWDMVMGAVKPVGPLGSGNLRVLGSWTGIWKMQLASLGMRWGGPVP